MRIYTIRKAKGGKILTFTKKFEKTLIDSHPWASRCFISKILQETSCSLDYEQQERIESSLKELRETTSEEYLALKWLESGVRLLDTELENVFKILDFAVSSIFKNPLK